MMVNKFVALILLASVFGCDGNDNIVKISCEKKSSNGYKKESKSKNDLIFSDYYPENQVKFKYYQDFNLDSLGPEWRKETTKNNSYSINSNKLGRFKDAYIVTEMSSTGKNGEAKRSEYGINLFDVKGQVKFLAYSFKIDKSFIFDAENLEREVMISQFHSKPEPDSNWDIYRKQNKFNRPSIALFLTSPNNIDYFIILRYGLNGKDSFEYKDFEWRPIAVKKVVKNEWIDIVFEIKWSFSNTGYIATWINNESFTPNNGITNRVYGANMHNGAPNYFKFGQYRYFDDSNKHRISFDELRVGDTFDEVSLYKNVPEMMKANIKTNFISMQN